MAAAELSIVTPPGGPLVPADDKGSQEWAYLPLKSRVIAFAEKIKTIVFPVTWTGDEKAFANLLLKHMKDDLMAAAWWSWEKGANDPPFYRRQLAATQYDGLPGWKELQRRTLLGRALVEERCNATRGGCEVMQWFKNLHQLELQCTYEPEDLECLDKDKQDKEKAMKKEKEKEKEKQVGASNTHEADIKSDPNTVTITFTGKITIKDYGNGSVLVLESKLPTSMETVTVAPHGNLEVIANGGLLVVKGTNPNGGISTTNNLAC